MKSQGHLATLQQWAEWGRSVPRRSEPNWSAVDILIEAARPRLSEDAAELRALLEESSRQLQLTDPLLNDLGVHRWLEGETSYSDWLAWVLERLGDSVSVLAIFGLEESQFASKCQGKVRVQREVELSRGLPGCKGRIDLLISFGEPAAAVLAVEVKTDDEQYEKQQGYAESLQRLGLPHKCVLVARDEIPSDRLCGFRLRKWRDVSLALRQAITRYARSHAHHAVRAMMLALVAAVEQNLLRFDTSAPRRAWQRRPTLLSRELAEYLQEALGAKNR